MNKDFEKLQLQILRQQTRISEKQNTFTELLALATIILGLGTFLSLFNISFNVGNWTSSSFFLNAVKGFVMFVGGLLFVVVFVLFIKSIFYLCGGEKKNQRVNTSELEK